MHACKSNHASLIHAVHHSCDAGVILATFILYLSRPSALSFPLCRPLSPASGASKAAMMIKRPIRGLRFGVFGVLEVHIRFLSPPLGTRGCVMVLLPPQSSNSLLPMRIVNEKAKVKSRALLVVWIEASRA